MEFYEERVHIARKQHLCLLCECIIPIGSRSMSVVGKTNGDFFAEQHLKRRAKYGGVTRAVYLQAFVNYELPQTLPTPTAHNAQEGAYPAEYTRNTPTLATHAGGRLNPPWVEWLMGWPIGWTALEPLETGRFQQWLEQHGNC